MAMLTSLAKETSDEVKTLFEHGTGVLATLAALCLHGSQNAQVAETACVCLALLCRDSTGVSGSLWDPKLAYEVLRGVVHSVLGPHRKDMGLLVEACRVLESLAGTGDQVCIPASRALLQLFRDHPKAVHLTPAVCFALSAIAASTPSVVIELRAQRCHQDLIDAIQNAPKNPRIVESTLSLLYPLVADAPGADTTVGDRYRREVRGTENAVAAAVEMHKGEAQAGLRQLGQQVASNSNIQP